MAFDLATYRGSPTFGSPAKFGTGALSGGLISKVTGTSGAGLPDVFLSSTGIDGGQFMTGTVEAWLRLASNPGTTKVAFSHPGWWWIGVNGLTINVNVQGVGTLSGGTMTAGTWSHVAVVWRAASGVDVYLDGSRVATSATRGSTSTTIQGFDLGGLESQSTFDWPGSIDEVRLSTVAQYTGTTYTVPTAAFVGDANTAALYHLESSGADNTADPGGGGGGATSLPAARGSFSRVRSRSRNRA